MTEPGGNPRLPRRDEQPEAQLIVLNYLNLQGIQVPHAARRRWRRQALHRERCSQEEWIATEGASERRTPTPPPKVVDENDISAPFEPRLVATVGRVWELQRTPGAAPNSIGDWDGTAPDPADLAQAADYAALLLDVFSRVKPVNDTQLAPVHKELVEKALISVLGIKRRLRVIEVSEDGNDQGLEPMPVPEEPSLSVYSGCVVCYAAVSDILLVPCHHLTLCEVCLASQLGRGWLG